MIQVFALTVLPCNINLMVNDNDPLISKKEITALKNHHLRNFAYVTLKVYTVDPSMMSRNDVEGPIVASEGTFQLKY